MLRGFKRPMFAPDGVTGGPDDFEAFKRTTLRAAKDAGRAAAKDEFADLLEEAGFKTAADLKAFVKDTKKGPVVPEVIPTVTPIEGAKIADLADPVKIAADKVANDAKVKENAKVMAKLIAAGVKDDDLDWAVSRFEAKKADLPPSGVATFGVDAFVSELKTTQPTMFAAVETPVVPVVPVVEGAVPPAGTPPTSGNSNTPPPAPPSAGFNAKGKTPAEVNDRLKALNLGK